MSYASTGYGRRARERFRRDLFPALNSFRARMGYDAAGLFRMLETASGPLVDDVAGVQLAQVGGLVNLYRRWFRQGVHVPGAAYGWALAGAYQPGAASQAVVGGFSMVAHAAANIGLWGFNSTDTTRLYARVLTASDKVQVNIVDPSAAHVGSVTIDHALVFGDPYALAYHVNQTTNRLYTSLRNLHTETEYTGTPLDISAYNALTSGGTSTFYVGAIPGIVDGTGITHLGLAIVDDGVEGVNVASNLTAALIEF